MVLRFRFLHRYLAVFGSVLITLLVSVVPDAVAQTVLMEDKSVARNWNEVLLGAIRRDFARPTVHARNLFHTSAAMYDAWAFYDPIAEPFLLGNTVGGYSCELAFGFAQQRLRQNMFIRDRKAASEIAMSFAMYRLLSHRFVNSPGQALSQFNFDTLMQELGLNINFTSTNYLGSSAAALGNYIAQCYIEFGLQDGSNEQNLYVNQFYLPINAPLNLTNPLNPTLFGNSSITNPDRWQPLQLSAFIDQSGNPIPGSTPPALTPEWGKVVPFSLTEDDLTIYKRNGDEYWIYCDPGKPALLNGSGALPEEYKWNHTLVAVWSSHLDSSDGVMWDISPGCMGDSPSLPTTIPGMRSFYDLENGNGGGNDGTGNCNYDGPRTGTGRPLNPATGEPYEPQIVPRGDYTRVLAEFWADGPASETPPGHWFSILNHSVSDHPQFEKRFEGKGPVLDDLEWDVKAYLVLGGAVHDAGVAAWGIKGWYDYVRPVSAFRYMAEQGQSSDPSGPNYDPDGLPLIPGYVEMVEIGDPLAGGSNENVDEVKVRAWRAHAFIGNPQTDAAGVDWILAKNWWPYQRPTFVTPPFPGYISGHSTFSRTAAEALTLLTGDEYFPGGMGVYEASQNDFLVFEEGPSVDVTLQWATYRDASDQTSLSRIWGSIHPPVDDIPGRRIGTILGPQAFAKAKTLFNGGFNRWGLSMDGGGGSIGWGIILLAGLGLFGRMLYKRGCLNQIRTNIHFEE